MMFNSSTDKFMFHSRQNTQKNATHETPNLHRFDKVIRSLQPLNRLPRAAVDALIADTALEEFAADASITRRLKDSKRVAYLVAGTIHLVSEDGHEETLEAGTANALKAIDRRSSAFTAVTAVTPCALIKIPWELLESYLPKGRPGDWSGSFEVNEILATTASDWMVKLLQSDLFSQLPATNIQEVLSLGVSIRKSAGERIIEQGENGADFFIIESGACVVTRKTSKSDREIKLATLGPADCFGEESLITGGPRGATVSMTTDGSVLKLSGDHFKRWLMEPLISRASIGRAKSLANEGCRWIDTRDAKLFADGAIPGSKNIAVSMIRLSANSLPADETYIVCDADPKVAAVGAFLLTIRGFNAHSLDASIEDYCAATGTELVPPGEAASETTDPIDLPATDESTGADDSDVAGTMDVIDQLAEQHGDIADDEPAIVADFAETVTGIGLAQLMGELTKKYKDGSTSAAELSEAQPITDFAEADTADCAANDNSGAPQQNETSPEPSEAAAAPPTQSKTGTVESFKARLAGELNELAVNLESKLAGHVEQLLADQRAAMEKEFEQRLAEAEFEAQKSMKVHELKVARAYKNKYKGIQENGRKLIALANKISKQKSELQAAQKLLEQQMANAE